MNLSDLKINEGRFRTLIQMAVQEDLDIVGDITTQMSLQDAETPSIAHLLAKVGGVVAGLSLVPSVLQEFGQAAHDILHRASFDTFLTFLARSRDGQRVEAKTCLGVLQGSRADLLRVERTLLNFLQRLSGMATLTRQFVDAVIDTDAKIYDTRKTTPGWRDLEKYAVRCGGGHNHRQGLYDAILVKDNHLSRIPTDRLAHWAFEFLNELDARKTAGKVDSSADRHEQSGPQGLNPEFVEFEVDSIVQLEQLLKVVGIDIILLDNFSIEDLQRAVEMRDRAGLKGKLQLEASGGVNLQTVRAIAQTGVERIAVGAITHSAAALDLSLEIT